MLKAPTSAGFPLVDVVEAALRRTGASADASESHGSLCGLLCVLGRQGHGSWLAETLADADSGAGDQVVPEAVQLLSTLAASSCGALEAGDMSFQLLVPEDSEPLGARAAHLARWCQAFNQGLFAGARIAESGSELEQANVAEIVRDFGELAQLAPDDDTGDEAEAAYAELVEYVRVSVQLVFEELTKVRQRVLAAGLH